MDLFFCFLFVFFQSLVYGNSLCQKAGLKLNRRVVREIHVKRSTLWPEIYSLLKSGRAHYNSKGIDNLGRIKFWDLPLGGFKFFHGHILELDNKEGILALSYKDLQLCLFQPFTNLKAYL